MPNPITVTIAPAQRSGTFSSGQRIIPTGYSNFDFTLTGMGTGSDYENTANGVAAKLFVDTSGGTNFTEYDMFTWVGGHVVIKGVTDPTVEESYPFANVAPPGSNAFIEIDLSGTFTVGMSLTIS